jgi:ATP-dependent RNA helicase RhlB
LARLNQFSKARAPSPQEENMTDASETSAFERTERPNFLTNVPFESFDLPPSVLAGLNDAGYTHCSPIQAQVLPIALAGRDVAGQAQTGTGKTGAFLVTILSRLLEMPERQPGVPAAIVVAPTRELAAQIHQEALLLGAHTGLTFVEIVGGIDYQKQAETLKRGVDVVICTPGRIIDYYKQGIFKAEHIKIVVIDEADRLLDLGFAKDMRYILRKLPPYDQRQSMLFSATLSHRVLELTYEYMNLPEFIDVAPEEITVDRIEQSLLHVGQDQKFSLLLGILKREDWSRVLIFTNTKSEVEWISKKLRGNGLPAEGITGDLPQRKRFSLMDRFKKNTVKILVATDVASRGIHVEDISHVINYDLPQDAENYVHRIGRTARAGKAGRAISLACERFVLHLEPIEKMLGCKIPVVWPEEDWFEEDVSGPVKRIRPERPKRGEGRKDRPRVGDRDRGPRPDKPQGRKPPALPSKPPGYFPGTFFGFGPPDAVLPPIDEDDIEEVDFDEAEEAVETCAAVDEAPPPAEPAKKKRRRSRRRRRTKDRPTAGDAAAAEESAPAESAYRPAEAPTRAQDGEPGAPGA